MVWTWAAARKSDQAAARRERGDLSFFLQPGVKKRGIFTNGAVNIYIIFTRLDVIMDVIIFFFTMWITSYEPVFMRPRAFFLQRCEKIAKLNKTKLNKYNYKKNNKA